MLTHLEIAGGYGEIVDGEVRDSDYSGDDRAIEVSRFANKTDNGDVLDLSFAVGPKFRLLDNRVSLIPLVGYSYNEQNLTLSDGNQVIPQVGLIQGLDSTYEAKWQGPWVGLKVYYRANDRIKLRSMFEYHLTDFDAEANWNLRTDLEHPRSFDHSADGQGWSVGGGVDYFLNEGFFIGLRGNYLSWETDAGVDRVCFKNGAISETRLNEVSWDSLSFGLTLELAF